MQNKIKQHENESFAVVKISLKRAVDFLRIPYIYFIYSLFITIEAHLNPKNDLFDELRKLFY